MAKGLITLLDKDITTLGLNVDNLFDRSLWNNCPSMTQYTQQAILDNY